MRTLVHTALEPVQHMLTVHNAKYREGFTAVNEAKQPVAEASSTPKCGPDFHHGWHLVELAAWL